MYFSWYFVLNLIDYEMCKGMYCFFSFIIFFKDILNDRKERSIFYLVKRVGCFSKRKIYLILYKICYWYLIKLLYRK